MNRIFKYILASASAALLIGTCVVLPEAFSIYSDKQMLDRIYQEELELTGVEYTPDSSFFDRLSFFIQNYTNMQSVQLYTGNQYDELGITYKAMEEITILQEMGLFPEYTVTRGDLELVRAYLCIMPESPAINALVWQVIFFTDRGGAYLYLDDETGKILTFYVFLHRSNEIVIREPIREGSLTQYEAVKSVSQELEQLYGEGQIQSIFEKLSLYFDLGMESAEILVPENMDPRLLDAYGFDAKGFGLPYDAAYSFTFSSGTDKSVSYPVFCFDQVISFGSFDPVFPTNSYPSINK